MRKVKTRTEKIKSFLIPKLRRMSYQWPERAKAFHTAKRFIQVGRFKNGKPKFKMKFECECCNNLFDKEDIQLDHKDPIVDVNTGFVDWNTYIDRMFCDYDNWQVLCRGDHELKTQMEQESRKIVREQRQKARDNEDTE